MLLSPIEKNLRKKGFSSIAGVDEAGRGALAGPVFAAAVILPKTVKIKGLDDSKKLSPKNREMIYSSIIQLQNELSLSMLLIEQNVKYAINYSDYLYLMRLGKLEKLNKETINIKELFMD